MLSALLLLIRDARLRRLAIAPLLVNVLLVLAGLPVLAWLGYSAADTALPAIETWPAALETLARVLAAVAVSIVGVLTLLVIGRILAAPMMTRLSEAVEERVMGEGYRARETSLRGDVVDAARSVGFAIGRLVMFLALYPVVLLSGLIPVAGPVIAPVLAFLYGSFVLSLDFSEPVFERHLIGFGNRVRYVAARPVRYLGFGGTAFLMALIPFANLVILPVCTAAATKLFVEEMKNGPTR